MTLPDLGGLLEALATADIEFVVIGGVAVAAHGFVRATQDLDIVPSPDRDNLDRLVNCLVLLDARLTLSPDRMLGPAERQALYRGRNLSVTTRLGELDVVQRLPGIPGFQHLSENAGSVKPFGSTLRVASRADLIDMKRARGEAIDVADLEQLERED